MAQTYTMEDALCMGIESIYEARDVSSVDDLNGLITNNRCLKYDSVFNAFLPEGRTKTTIRINDTQGIDVFYNGRYLLTADRLFRCGSTVQLRGSSVIRSLYSIDNSNKLVDIGHGEHEDYLFEAFSPYYQKMFADSSLAPDLVMSRKQHNFYTLCTTWMSGQSGLSLKLHPWVYKKGEGARMRCDCGSDSDTCGIAFLNTICREVCDNLGIDNLYFDSYNWSKKINNDFHDLYLRRYPKLKLPYAVVDGKPILQHFQMFEKDTISSVYVPEICIGANRIDDVYVALRKKTIEERYILKTFSVEGIEGDSIVFMSDSERKANFIITQSGRIYDINDNRGYVVCPNGKIDVIIERKE